MQTATALKTLPIPAHFDPNSVGDVRRVNYGSIATQARQYGKDHGVKPASKDDVKVGLLAIDVQLTFCGKDFELFVGGHSGSGAIDDTRRLCEFIYQNGEIIHRIHPTMDTHTAIQIFHEVFFVNDQGEHPIPMVAPITTSDVKSGIWKVNPAIADTLGIPYMTLQQHVTHYVNELERQGKFLLMIWPYHAMLGGIGHALVPAFEEACFFHNHLRSSQTGIEIKGGNPLTENYSILRPEVLTTYNGSAIAQRNAKFIEQLVTYDMLVIAGQAKSHCVAWTIDDLLNEINAKDPTLTKKVYLLEDCTSAVVVPGVIDFTPQADEAFERFKAAGMHVVHSTDPIENWPGVPF